MKLDDRSTIRRFGKADPSKLFSIPSLLSLNSASTDAPSTSSIAELTSPHSRDATRTKKIVPKKKKSRKKVLHYFDVTICVKLVCSTDRRFRLKTLKLHLTLCYQTFISFESKSKTKIQKCNTKNNNFTTSNLNLNIFILP